LSTEQIAAIKVKRLGKKRGTIKTGDLEGGVVRIREGVKIAEM